MLFLFETSLIFSAAVCAAVVSTVLKINPYINNVRVPTLSPSLSLGCNIRGKEKVLIHA